MANREATDCFQRARRALKKSPIRILRNVRVDKQVDKSGETMVLTGRVDSFYLKQMAQELVRTVAQDVELINSIDVE